MVFLTFLKFSLKFREQIPCREAASNALRGKKLGFNVALLLFFGYFWVFFLCFLFFFCFGVLLVYSLYAQGHLYAFLILFRFRNNSASPQKESKKTHNTQSPHNTANTVEAPIKQPKLALKLSQPNKRPNSPEIPNNPPKKQPPNPKPKPTEAGKHKNLGSLREGIAESIYRRQMGFAF
jgi:hypothetical protein